MNPKEKPSYDPVKKRTTPDADSDIDIWIYGNREAIESLVKAWQHAWLDGPVSIRHLRYELRLESDDGLPVDELNWERRKLMDSVLVWSATTPSPERPKTDPSGTGDILEPWLQPQARLESWWGKTLYYSAVGAWEGLFFQGVAWMVIPRLLVGFHGNSLVSIAVGSLWAGPLFLFAHTIVRWLVLRQKDEWEGWELELHKDFWSRKALVRLAFNLPFLLTILLSQLFPSIPITHALTLFALGLTVAGHAAWDFAQPSSFASALTAGRHEESNIRRDLTNEIRAALLSPDPGTFLQLIQQAARSELDYFVFVACLNRLMAQEASLHKALGKQFLALLERVHDTDLLHSALGRLWVISKRWLTHEDLVGKDIMAWSADHRLWVFNEKTAMGASPLTRGDDWSATEMMSILCELLLSDHGPSEFLLTSIRDAAHDASVAGSSFIEPLMTLRIQGGRFQHVYVVLVSLRDGRLVPVTVLVARGPGASDTVRNEFSNLIQHQGDERLVKVLHLGSVMRQQHPIYAYSSEFLNDYGEVWYNSSSIAELILFNDVRVAGQFFLNSSHPLCIGNIMGEHDMVNFLSRIIQLIVHFYDPKTKMMLDGLRLSSGDINIDERALTVIPHPVDIFPKRTVLPETVNLKLIAWRATRQGVEPPDLLRYLFRLSFLHNDRDRIVTSPPLDRWLVDGVLRGLREGLIERYGQQRGRSITRQWLREYLRTTETEDPLFTSERLRAFAGTLDAELAQQALTFRVGSWVTRLATRLRVSVAAGKGESGGLLVDCLAAVATLLLVALAIVKIPLATVFIGVITHPVLIKLFKSHDHSSGRVFHPSYIVLCAA